MDENLKNGVKRLDQLNFMERLDRLRYQALDALGVKPRLSVYLKSLDGDILAWKHHLPKLKEEEFIASFKADHKEAGFFVVEQVQYPYDLYSAKAAEIEQVLWRNGKDSVTTYSYYLNRLESYISHTLSEQLKICPLPSLYTGEEAQLIAVQQDVFALTSIKNPSETVQMAAMEKDMGCITLLENPCEKAQIYAAERDPFSVTLYPSSDAARMVAVKQDPTIIEKIENPSEAVQLAAVKQSGEALRWIENPSEAVQLAAVQQNTDAILHIEKPSEEVQLAAVQQNGNYIQTISNPSEAVQLAAVRENRKALYWIENPSEAVQLAAVQQSGEAITQTKTEGETSLTPPSRAITEKEPTLQAEESIKEQLQKLGVPISIQQKCITELLTKGKTTELVPIQTTLLNQEVNASVRLSIGNNDRGENLLKLHFIRKELSNDVNLPFMGHYFTEEQKRNLLSTRNAGEAIQVTDTKGNTERVLVSVDKLTGELVALPVAKVLIPDTFSGVNLTQEDKLKLKDGHSLVLESVKANQNTSFSITVQYNADLRKVVALPNSNKIKIIGGVKLSEKQSEALRQGASVQVAGMIDDKGEKYSAYVKLNQNNQTVNITPTNDHKVQVSHNSRGEKTEENKRAEKHSDQPSVKSGTHQVKHDRSKLRL